MKENGKLMYCPDCGHQISTKAKSCPNCGRPITVKDRPHQKMTSEKLITGLSSIFIVFLIIAGIGFFLGSDIIFFGAIGLFLIAVSFVLGEYLNDRGYDNKKIWKNIILPIIIFIILIVWLQWIGLIIFLIGIGLIWILNKLNKPAKSRKKNYKRKRI